MTSSIKGFPGNCPDKIKHGNLRNCATFKILENCFIKERADNCLTVYSPKRCKNNITRTLLIYRLPPLIPVLYCFFFLSLPSSVLFSLMPLMLSCPMSSMVFLSFFPVLLLPIHILFCVHSHQVPISF